MTNIELERLGKVIEEAKKVAKEYKRLTGRPLGITGEVVEYEAARALNLELSEVRQEGYDAICRVDGTERRIQIKGRCIPSNAKPGQRLGSINLDKEWDTVLLVILDEAFEPIEMYEAPRVKVKEALTRPGSKARNERGQLGISQFKNIAKKVWVRKENAD